MQEFKSKEKVEKGVHKNTIGSCKTYMTHKTLQTKSQGIDGVTALERSVAYATGEFKSI